MTDVLAEIAPAKRVCGARLANKPGQFCRSPVVMANGRCRIHGGATPRGTASPHWRGRGYSKDLPTQLADRMRQALDDPELLSVRHEVALLDARLGELMGALSTGGTEEAWEETRIATRQLRQLVEKPHQDGRDVALTSAVERLEHALEGVHADARAWDDILKSVGVRRRLVDTERKREELLAGTMLSSQAMAFVAALQIAIQDCIPEGDVDTPGEKIRARLGRRIRQLLGKQAADEAPQFIEYQELREADDAGGVAKN